MATRAQLEADIVTYTASLNALNQRYDAAQAAGDTALAAQIAVGRAAAERLLAAAEKELAALPPLPSTTEPPGSTAAGAVADSGNTTSTPGPRLTPGEADALAGGTDSGTNPPVKTLTDTQANPAPGGAPGAGLPPDAVPGRSAATTTQIINSFDRATFAPKNNVLDQYASYTYSLSWYLLTPAVYRLLLTTKKINLPSSALLVQSGGAPVSNNGQGRNQFFGLDYYIDDFEIKSTITGRGTGRAHNAAELSFTITEPAGITLIDNLSSAVKTAYANTGVQYVAALYAMVIRFYGYDDTGKQVTASDSDNNSAVVEKIIPFKLSDLQFRVENKLVEYKVTGVATPYSVGYGSNLGVIKAPIELAGGTVKDLLTNGVVLAEVSPADGQQTTATPSTPQSTVNSSTSFLENYVNEAPKNIADTIAERESTGL